MKLHVALSFWSEIENEAFGRYHGEGIDPVLPYGSWLSLYVTSSYRCEPLSATFKTVARKAICPFGARGVGVVKCGMQ